MALLDLWTHSPEQLQGKQVQQLIAFSGAGQLLDESPCSVEFRAFLASVPSSNLVEYSEQCLRKTFQDSGLVLQDIVNEVGVRVGAVVERGRYRGTTNHTGNDGLSRQADAAAQRGANECGIHVWKFPTGHSIVVEVKTTDAYRIDLNTIAMYRDQLVGKRAVEEHASSILLVVGREDTGDLEAQIRGSRHAWDIRIISVLALLRLMKIKEAVEDPETVKRIHNILIPREFTRLDDIAEILFSAAEDIKEEESLTSVEKELEEEAIEKPKLAPVAFHEACVERVSEKLKTAFVKRSRAGYSSPDKSVALNCSVSKEYDPETHPSYWFAFHPHQQEFLREHTKAYVAFGCGSSKQLLLIPFDDFEQWLDMTWTTITKEDRMYWHVVIFRQGNTYTMRRRKGQKTVDLSPYLVAESNPAVVSSFLSHPGIKNA